MRHVRIWFFQILLNFHIAINNGILNLFFILVMPIAQEGQFIPLPSLRWWHNHSYFCERTLLIYGERSIPTSRVKKVRVRNLHFFESLDLNLSFISPASLLFTGIFIPNLFQESLPQSVNC